MFTILNLQAGSALVVLPFAASLAGPPALVAMLALVGRLVVAWWWLLVVAWWWLLVVAIGGSLVGRRP